MDWRLRSLRRPTVNEPGHAHALTFSCFYRFPFLQAERTARPGGPRVRRERVERRVVRGEERAEARPDCLRRRLFGSKGK